MLCILAILMLLLLLAGCQESDKTKYENAKSLLTKGQFAEASEQFDKLGSYEDSTQLAMYCKAIIAGDAGDYKTAIKAFESLGDFKDSRLMISYYTALDSGTASDDDTNMEKATKWLSAAKQLDAIELFRDSKEKSNEFRKKIHDLALSVNATGDYLSAREILGIIDDGNTENEILLTYYTEGIKKKEQKDWSAAIEAFTNAREYQDSKAQIIEISILWGKDLANSGEESEAVKLLTPLQTDDRANNVLSQIQRKIDLRTPGNCIVWGKYEQDNIQDNGDESIEWIVLDVKDDKSMLISKYGLDSLPFDKLHKADTWENCSLREWLNTEFYNKAFNDRERKAILSSDVGNNTTQGSDYVNTPSLNHNSNNIKDIVSILSYSECETYDNCLKQYLAFSSTPYSESKRAGDRFVSGESSWSICFWIRTRYRIKPERATAYWYNGSTAGTRSTAAEYQHLVNPVIWLDWGSITIE